jgi:O-antigen ligase
MAALAATCPVSIFAAQSIGLSLAVLVFLVRLARGRTRLERSPLDGPILAFSVWTLLSAAFSADPLTSHDSAKKLVLFALFYLSVEALTPEHDRERIFDAALLGGLALAAGILLQYYFLGFDTLLNRPHSFLGHYMTASGLVMAVLVVAAARLAFHRGRLPRPSTRDLRALAVLILALTVMTALQAIDLFAVEAERLFVAGLAAVGAWMALSRGPWPGPATGTTIALTLVPVASWALVVSRTRNAWLGALVGLAVVAILRAPKLLWGLAAAVGIVLVLRPAPVVGRLTVVDPSSVDRYYMWQAGIDMIRDKPVFGQGPGRILAVYPEYRWPQAPNALQPHLHDNALQIAAERGLPCLAWWLWFVAAAMGDAWREVRGGGGWPAVAALAFLAAFMAAGLFEYNFGDSEILMFTLLVAALPYALRRQRARAAAAA